MAVRLSRFRFTDSLSSALGFLLLVALAQPACADGTLVNINQQSHQQTDGSYGYSTDDWNTSGIQYTSTSKGTLHAPDFGSEIGGSATAYTNSMAFVPITMRVGIVTTQPYTFDIGFSIAKGIDDEKGVVDQALMTSLTLDLFSLGARISSSVNAPHKTEQSIKCTFTLKSGDSTVTTWSQNVTLKKANSDTSVAAYTKGSDGTYTSAAIGSTVSGATVTLNLNSQQQQELQAGQVYTLSVRVEDNTSLAHTYRTGIGQLSVGVNSDAYVWIGDKNNTWSSGAANWNHDSNAEGFLSNDVNNAIFGTKGQQKTVSLGEDITADRVIVQTDGYTWALNEKTLKSSSVEISDDATLTVSGTGSVETGKLSGGNTATVAKDGNNTSTVQVSGGATDFHGNIKVSDGVLEIQSATELNVKDVMLDGGELLLKNTEATVGWQVMEVSGTLKGGAAGTGASGNITLASGAVLDASAAAGNGGINLTGAVTLNYGAQLSQNDLNIFVPGVLPGARYDLLTVTGDLTLTDSEGHTIDAKTLGEGYDAAKLFRNFTEGYFDLRYRSTGDNVGTFYLYTVVPEPTTGTLSLLALCVLTARRRRKN